MFFENYVRLCNSVGKTPSAVALEMGIAKPTVTRWKNGSTPNSATLYKVADYFGVSAEYLIGNEEQKEKHPAKNGRVLNKTNYKVFLESLSNSELMELNAELAELMKERAKNEDQS